MADNMMCPAHKDNKKYRDNYDAIFQKKKLKSMKTYTFVEPHHTGGHCMVEINEKQILKHMHNLQKENKRFKEVSDEDLLDYFIVNYWCKEKGLF